MTDDSRWAVTFSISVCFALGSLFVIAIVAMAPQAPLPIDHRLDAGRAAQVRAWTGGEAEKPVRVCCPCPCGALAFCKGGDE